MKPNIIKWTYIALGYVLLNNTLSVLHVFQHGGSTLLYPGLSIIYIIASIVAIIGLIKVAPWSRIVAFILIGTQAIGTILTSVVFVVDTESSIVDMLMSALIFDILLLFLAFQLYSSKPLKNYLSNRV